MLNPTGSQSIVLLSPAEYALFGRATLSKKEYCIALHFVSTCSIIYLAWYIVPYALAGLG